MEEKRRDRAAGGKGRPRDRSTVSDVKRLFARFLGFVVFFFLLLLLLLSSGLQHLVHQPDSSRRTELVKGKGGMIVSTERMSVRTVC